MIGRYAVMKTYTIIGGVGKSSLTGVLKKTVKNLGKIIDVDKINANEGGNAVLGGKIAVKTIDECIKKGVCFTQEATLSGRKTAKTAKRALENGYFVRLYYIGLDTVEKSLKRIENRVLKGGHNIPKKMLQDGLIPVFLIYKPFYPTVTKLFFTTMKTVLEWSANI